MIKTLFIQELYGLTDESTERELYDRITFRDRPSSPGMDRKLWGPRKKGVKTDTCRRRRGWIRKGSGVKGDKDPDQ